MATKKVSKKLTLDPKDGYSDDTQDNFRCFLDEKSNAYAGHQYDAPYVASDMKYVSDGSIGLTIHDGSKTVCFYLAATDEGEDILKALYDAVEVALDDLVHARDCADELRKKYGIKD